ncbi:MAG: hypothetical protein A2275_07470 [Bacteroidetes bacterium RIFOXYA12_FULL_35_11]|nr:MAG: hypothetical protein A2X01_04290 [Bacteroidetes bacterium GWF2_35_48]OFY73128.1 MAG: hypothetical protein A2275_07470 [Bacteroidetes bacterium RIFOXYA12_FULL_35_11]HBX51570.1 hypothetical protein [Bacteroidales bacterium]
MNENNYHVLVRYNMQVDLPRLEWMQNSYPEYEDILDRLKRLAADTSTPLSFFEKNALAMVNCLWQNDTKAFSIYF